ncbi:hypothetical protein [Streptomyces sp. NPDC005507]|uniref:hypothetical protein n=1 Tax=Streptomyces sp. NPDC005507 TaxID=3154885 RepID=UPI0033BC8C58
MDVSHAPTLTVPLTATEQDQVQRAAAATGQTIDEFVRAAVLDAATDPFRDALEQAVATVARLAAEDRIQHDYAD